jgi:hypothetical protein
MRFSRNLSLLEELYMKGPMKLVDPTNGQIATDVASVTGAEDELATCVASFTTEYNNLDSTIYELTTELLEQSRKLVKRFDDELLPLVNRMWMLLSQRGNLHALVSRDRSLASELEQLADVPTWTQWYEAFSNRIMGAPSLRTIQRKLKKLRGCDEPETTVDVDATEDDTDESSVCGGLHEHEELKTGAELLAEHAKKMLDVLAGKSIMSDAMRISRATSLAKDLQRALEEGFLLEATPVAGNENVAVPPHTPDAPVSTLIPDPDWKQVLVELIDVLEQSGYRLPLVVLAEKRKIESLLADEAPRRPEGAVSTTAKRYKKVMKLDKEGNRCWTVKAEGEKKAWGTFENDSEADKAIASLNSPVTSLVDIGAASRMLPASVALVAAGCLDLHEGVA